MSRRKVNQRLRAAKLAAKNERRARLWAQGRTDDGRPLDDPAYYAWISENGVTQ